MNISESNQQAPAVIIDRLHPAVVRIKQRKALTGSQSTKATYHLTLDLTGSGLSYKVGDSIGIFAQNDPILVQHYIDALKADPQDRIIDPKSKIEMSLWDFLTYKANLSRVTSSFLKLFYEHEQTHDKKNQLRRLLDTENKPLLSQFLSSHDPLDLLKEYANTQAPLQDLCAQFGPLLPRFYSVASSPLNNPNEVDLTVALFTFTHSGEQRYGVASHFLSHIAKVGETPISVYTQPTHLFTLPEDKKIPMIMVGPGTGVAPFRAFLQERIALHATGKHWLFFGERNRASDYFYQDFFESLEQQDQLVLDLAFSRDQPEKKYVQHLMLEKAKELWNWLEQGAYFYVCGDAQKMAKDVEAALTCIAETEGKMSQEAAKAYVKSLRTQKRYLADVY